jgi:hypothetical protein
MIIPYFAVEVVGTETHTAGFSPVTNLFVLILSFEGFLLEFAKNLNYRMFCASSLRTSPLYE